jgi:hypothetical protein
MEDTTPGKDPQNHFSEDLGRLFEIGFNTGFLTAIYQQSKVKTHFGDLYQRDLSHLRLQSILTKMYERTGVINQADKEILRRWVLYFFQKGYLAGLNIFAEYLQSFQAHRPTLTREIVYLQCNFYGQNSLYTYSSKNDRAAVEDLLKQFQSFGHPAITLSEEEIKQHRQTGKFFNADTLLLLKYGRYWRILCLDLSVFSLRHLDEALNLSDVETTRRMLATELYYNRAKSAFSNMSIDTEKEALTGELLSGQLKNYFAAFKRNDKETAKLIQAASYAHDFYRFLLQKEILQPEDKVLFNILGYTDWAINAMSVKQDQMKLLETCAEIYQGKPGDRTIDEARDLVLSSIQRAARKGFGGKNEFVQNLVHLVDEGDGTRWLEHTETIEHFLNTRAPVFASHLSPDLRAELQPGEYEGKHILDVHALLTWKELESRLPYLFLTGNPGIGKTTAIVNFLKRARQRGEGFLFLYISPRKHVNLDIIEKFRTDTGEAACADVLALTSNSIMIRNNSAQKTVHYYSNQRHDKFEEQNVTFMHADSEEAKRQQISVRKLEEIQEGLLIDKGERISGVLDSLCTALHVALEKPLAQAIVATVAVQSLKRLKDPQKSTLDHLKTIFKGVYNEQGQVIPQKMELLRQNIKHLFIMIDEVTGDESGVAFLHGLHKFLVERELFQSPFINTKVIVADASIVDPAIINQHLEDTTYEPDKIYFRQTTAGTAQAYPLHKEKLDFRRMPASVINANAYPASKLHLTYKIGVDALQFDTTTFLERSKQLEQVTKGNIITDIIKALDKDNVPQQIVYIQNKQRLAELIQTIKKIRGTFEHKSDYLEIHANISERDKNDIKDHRKTARVIFMTASASRGLSFPEATHILIDIPHFEIEQNLMEILQVIYRGRGGQRDLEEKKLIFYLTDQIIYTELADRAYTVRENMLHLLNVLLILKTSMMTRITGSLKLGVNQHFMMVPIGGKSVYSAGETFTTRISNLIREAQTLSHRYYDDKRLKTVQESLMQTLEHVHISLRPVAAQHRAEREGKRQNYISQISTFADDFEQRIRQGFDQLLTMPPLEVAHINGSVLVVPIINMSMQEAYWMQFERVLEHNKAQGIDLVNTMYSLSLDDRYPPSFQTALKDGIALIRALQDMAEHKIPHYEQESSHTDQHYVLPLAVFLTQKEMSEHFAGKHEPENQDNPFRLPFHTLLARYIRALYPADSMLPIGEQYDDFPFLVFRSLNVHEARSKMFTGKYLFMSQELNILNMLLSSTQEQ